MRRLATSREVPDFNDLNDDVVVEVDVKEVLKSSIFVVQKAAAPKTGVEFCQASIGTIRSRLAMSCDTPTDVARAGACKNENVRSKKFDV